MENPKLKQSAASIALLDEIGSRNPFALALLIQLVATEDGVLSQLNVRHPAKAKKAILELSRFGLIEIDKEHLFSIRLIESDCVEWRVKKKRVQAVKQETWEERYIDRGGDIVKLNSWLIGKSRAANFYREQLADNFDREDEVFLRYAKLVNFMFTANEGNPLDYVLTIRDQLTFESFKKLLMKVPQATIEANLLQWQNKQYKNTSIALTINNWNSK